MTFFALPPARARVSKSGKLEGAATVDDQDVARDKLSGEEEENGIRNFFRTAGAAQRGAPDKIFLPFGGIAGHGDGAGSKGVDAHGGSELLGQNAGHEDDAGFREGVREKFAPAEETANIGKIDDDAASGFGEMRRGRLRAKERRFEIGVERSVPGLFRGCTEFRFQKVGGAVHEDVELPEVCDHVGNQLLDGRDAGELRREGGRAAAHFFNFGDKFTSFGGRFSIVHRDIGAFVREAERNSAAQALRSAGDQSHAARQFLFLSHAAKVA